MIQASSSPFRIERREACACVSLGFKFDPEKGTHHRKGTFHREGTAAVQFSSVACRLFKPHTLNTCGTPVEKECLALRNLLVRLHRATTVTLNHQEFVLGRTSLMTASLSVEAVPRSPLRSRKRPRCGGMSTTARHVCAGMFVSLIGHANLVDYAKASYNGGGLGGSFQNSIPLRRRDQPGERATHQMQCIETSQPSLRKNTCKAVGRAEEIEGSPNGKHKDE